MKIPAVFRYRRRRPFDHVASPRWVILWRQVLDGLRRRWQHARLVYLAPAWRHARPWVEGFAFVAALLLADSWMERRNLEGALEEAVQARSASDYKAQRLRDELGQVRARGNCQTLFYLVEARNPNEVFSKLTQASMQLEAARATEWVPAR